MTIPRISVIIPVYNTEAYLRPLFDSLCRQIFTDFEIVVINDGSTDNSLGVISKYSSFFGPRLRIYNRAGHPRPAHRPARHLLSAVHRRPGAGVTQNQQHKRPLPNGRRPFPAPGQGAKKGTSQRTPPFSISGKRMLFFFRTGR